MREVTVAATQMACSNDIDKNVSNAEKLVRQAASKGAQIILIQELFESQYFCMDQKEELFELSKPFDNHPTIKKFSELAKELKVVLPVSFFEKANRAHYNSVAIVDADGSILGKYRKSHIPDGPGYQEKFYFNPGDTGFKVWNTKYAKIGVGICWDQWFPECARSMALQGADILFYPTAIGSEPQNEEIYSKDHWQTVMRGHAAANLVGIVASNRIGKEKNNDVQLDFYGHSLIIDETGRILKELSKSDEGYVIHSFDISAIQSNRTAWGVFRDRRIDLYKETIL